MTVYNLKEVTNKLLKEWKWVHCIIHVLSVKLRMVISNDVQELGFLDFLGPKDFHQYFNHPRSTFFNLSNKINVLLS